MNALVDKQSIAVQERGMRLCIARSLYVTIPIAFVATREPLTDLRSRSSTWSVVGHPRLRVWCGELVRRVLPQIASPDRSMNREALVVPIH